MRRDSILHLIGKQAWALHPWHFAQRDRSRVIIVAHESEICGLGNVVLATLLVPATPRRDNGLQSVFGILQLGREG